MNRLVLIGIAVAAVIAVCTAEKDDFASEMMSTEEDTSEERKKQKNGLAQIYMAVMMLNSIVGTAFRGLDTIIKVKGFGLAVIGALINVARFVIQLKEHTKKHGDGFGGGGSGGGGGYDRRYVFWFAWYVEIINTVYCFKNTYFKRISSHHIREIVKQETSV